LDAAAVSLAIGEAVPVLVRRLQTTDEHAAGDVEMEPIAIGAARREQHAVVIGIAGGDAFGKEVAAFTPLHTSARRGGLAPGRGGAERGRELEECASADERHG
jgi:hypothetical protein